MRLAQTILLGGLVALLAVGTATAQDGPTAEVSIPDQTTDGDALIVETVRIPDGGFVVVQEDDAAPGENVLGVSGVLSAGYHEDVPVQLSGEVEHGQTVRAVLHMDSNSNSLFDHDEDPGLDPPYQDGDGNLVADEGEVSIEGASSIPAGPVAALAAVLAALAWTRR